MSTQSISIHSALQLIKKHKKRVENSRQVSLISIVQGEAQKPRAKGYKTKEELQKTLQSNYDYFYGSLDAIAVLKEKIAESNLKTTVNYLGEQVSITKVLAIKETLNDRKLRYNNLRKQLQDYEKIVNEDNSKEQTLIASTEDSNQRASREEQFIRFNELKIISYSDNISASQLVEKLAKELETLEFEIDTILSESNIGTTIEIPLNFS